MAGKMCVEISLVISMQNEWSRFFCVPVRENQQKEDQQRETRGHPDTTDYKTQVHHALLLVCTKDFRSQSNLTQEVGTINPIWRVLIQSETETQLPKMPCPKSHSKTLEAPMERLDPWPRQWRIICPWLKSKAVHWPNLRLQLCCLLADSKLGQISEVFHSVGSVSKESQEDTHCAWEQVQQTDNKQPRALRQTDRSADRPVWSSLGILNQYI